MTKRRLSIMIFAVCFLLVVCMLCGCNDVPSEIDYNLDEEIQREIITAFVNLYSNDFYTVTEEEVSLRCYGEFDGVYVLFVDVASLCYTDAIEEDTIVGVKFVYSCGQKMTVYSDGAFYTIAEAYENGILSYENLLTTQQTYKASHEYLYSEEK